MVFSNVALSWIFTTYLNKYLHMCKCSQMHPSPASNQPQVHNAALKLILRVKLYTPKFSLKPKSTLPHLSYSFLQRTRLTDTVTLLLWFLLLLFSFLFIFYLWRGRFTIFFPFFRWLNSSWNKEPFLSIYLEGMTNIKATENWYFIPVV